LLRRTNSNILFLSNQTIFTQSFGFYQTLSSEELLILLPVLGTVSNSCAKKMVVYYFRSNEWGAVVATFAALRHSMNCVVVVIIIILTLVNTDHKAVKNRDKKYKIRYNYHSSVCAICGRQTVMQKDSIEVLHKIKILWYRKLVSRASPEFAEILLARSSMRWRADALNTPKVSTAIDSK